eukprot:3532293-Karenia_brevis.AAC.1
MAIADRPPRPPAPIRAGQEPASTTETLTDRIDRSLESEPAPNAQSKRLPRSPARRSVSRPRG